jgi:bcr-type benzoyl-CoA reductase subunit C
MAAGAVTQETPDFFREAREWKGASQGKVLAYLLPDIPEEIIHASGLYPFPLLSMRRRPALSEGRVPSFLCPVIRNPLEMAADGVLDFIDGLLIPYTCDTTRAFSHVWESLFPSLFSYTLWLPKKVQAPLSRAFLHSEFMRLKKTLEEFTKRKISHDALHRSIGLFNNCRKTLREIHRSRKKGASCFAYSDFMEIVKASMFMPTEEKNQALSALARDRGGNAARSGASTRVFLSGALCDSRDLLRDMEEMGLEVVDDDLYNGTRHFLQDANENGDPIEALVDRHMAKDPLHVYHYPRETWVQYLTERVRESAVRGFIFLTPEYCDPAQFEYPFIKELLHEWKIPVLYLETDFPAVVDAGMKTRLEAFAEMVKG